MNPKEMVSNLLTVLLLPLGMGIAAVALRGHFATALGVYALALIVAWLGRPETSLWVAQETFPRAIQAGCRRTFLLLILTTLNALGSCPTWFLGLMISVTLMQWTVYLVIRPSRLSPPLLPEISLWNRVAQAAIPAIFLADSLLIQRFPGNFRFSETFHLAGYAFLASLQVLQLAHDFFRMRRAVSFWVRALALQPR